MAEEKPKAASADEDTVNILDVVRRANEIVQPSVRTWQTWTPAMIRAAERAADSGYLRQAADLCDWVLKDDKVKGALEPRINALLGLPVTFEASGDGRKRKKAVRALEAGEDWDYIYPDPEAKQALSWALMLGIGPGYFAWARRKDHDDRDLPRLNFYHPQSLSYDWNRRTWMRTLETGGQQAIHFGDGVWFAHMPYGTFRPWALGMLWGIAQWVLLKAYAKSDLGLASETAVRNVVEIERPSGEEGDWDPKEKRKELANDLARLARSASIVLPPGWRYKLVELGKATTDLIQAIITMADNAIAIQIRGGNLSTDVKGGSKAAAESQQQTGDIPNLRQDAGGWATSTHDQGLTFWSFANFGSMSLAPWPVYDTEPDEDRKAKADTFKVALEGAKEAAAQGFRVKREEFAKEFGLSGFLEPGEVPIPPLPPAAPDPEGDAPEETEEQASEVAQSADTVIEALAGKKQVIVAGGPRSGKSTIGARAGERFKLKVRHGDSLIGKKKWSEASDEVAGWLDESDQWLVEGVVAVRALRKWLKRNPGKALNATVVWLRDPVQARTKRQAAMAKSVEKIWNEILPDLTARGVALVQRDT